MLSVPCGLPSYVGPWPPVARERDLIEPLADLARCTAHCSAASGDAPKRLYPEEERATADGRSA